MTPNAKAARDGRSSGKLTAAGISADLDSRPRSAYNSTPRETPNTRRRQAAQREAASLPENVLLTVDQICAELHISRSTFYDWRAKGKGPPVHRAAQRQPAGPACRLGSVAECPYCRISGELACDARPGRLRSTVASAEEQAGGGCPVGRAAVL